VTAALIIQVEKKKFCLVSERIKKNGVFPRVIYKNQRSCGKILSSG